MKSSAATMTSLLLSNHFRRSLYFISLKYEWFGDYSVWSCPCVRVSVRVQKLFHHLLLAATSQEIDTYTI